MTEHVTRLVEWGAKKAEIDEGIADLILEIWKADIDTCNSCENNVPDGWVWIQFSTIADGERFLNVVAGKYSPNWNSLYSRLCNPGYQPDQTPLKFWQYKVHAHDYSVEEVVNDDGVIIEIPVDLPEIELMLSVRFPRTDLATVLRRVVKYNKERSQMEACPHCLKAHS